MEAEKQKLEKKVETLKAKLVEVLHNAATLQDNATKKVRFNHHQAARVYGWIIYPGPVNPCSKSLHFYPYSQVNVPVP